MKVLIITYYWPPSGGSGVQRWLKFVKYLQNFGIEPIVYTVSNPLYPTIDNSLLDEIPKGIEVLKKPIIDPQRLVTRLFGKKTENNIGKSSQKGFLPWVRGNFFIPDPKMFWVRPSVSFLKKYLKENKVDVIISTGPPHSMHLIAKKLKAATKIPWIADFRDPWSGLYYTTDFKLSSFARKRNEKLENGVLKNADVVIAVGDFLKKVLEGKASLVEVITNGYDQEVFIQKATTLDSQFSIAHIGLLPKQSNPLILWKVLQEICAVDTEFSSCLELQMTGSVSEEVMDSITSHSLSEHVVSNGYVTHEKAIELQQKAQVLLLLIPKVENAKGIITGKIFEYVQAKRPILAIGPEDGDVATIIEETASGVIVDFEDAEKLKATILRMYRDFKKNNLVVSSKNVEKYHRKALTEKLSKIIKETIQN
ncbi:MAG: glycosyltransferase family 4 protein [Polaribacter sp.]|nr:glycosyltransferase family 4 protein [Polaribacter sp.]